MVDFDVLVIGAGVNGSSAAYHAAKSGSRTALVEQFPIPHSRGSSAGHSRIIRLATQSLAVCPYMESSMKQWKDMERETGTKLIEPASMIAVLNASNKEDQNKIRASLERSGITCTMKEASVFNPAYGTNFPEECVFFEDPTGGVMLSDKCINVLQELFLKSGGELFESFEVVNVSVARNGIVTVKSPSRQISCRKLIICAGPWTSNLLSPLGLVLPLSVVKIPVYYWQILKAAEFSRHVFFEDHSQYHVYGLPPVEYPGLMKVCPHEGVAINPDNRDKADLSQIRRFMQNFVADRMPFLNSTPSIEESCIYTKTPDNEMILDRHPLYKNIIFGCGFSGTGFKTAPAVGQTLFEMANGLLTTFDITEFRADRFPNSYLKISKI